LRKFNRFGFFRLALGLVASIIVLVQCARQEKDIYLKPVSWQKLPGWEKEDFSKALSVFQNSCKALQKANLAINLHGRHCT